MPKEENSTVRRHRLAVFVQKFGLVMPSHRSCLECQAAGRVCRTSPKSSSCGACLEHNSSCSLAITDKSLAREEEARKKLLAKLEAAEDEEADLRAKELAARARVRRLRKMLASRDARQKELWEREEKSIAELEELERLEQASAAAPSSLPVSSSADFEPLSFGVGSPSAWDPHIFSFPGDIPQASSGNASGS